MNEYGHFSSDGKEYIITCPNTPRPWINYLTNGNYVALCSHRAGGFSCYQDHRFNNILRRGEQVQLEDVPGRFFFVKDMETGEIWSLGGHPIPEKCDYFEARQGIGYTKISSTYDGIEAHQRYFVPRGHNCEIWTASLKNTSSKPRKLSVVSYAELMLGNWFIEVNEPAFASLFNIVKQDSRTAVYRKQWWNTCASWDEHNEPWPWRIFATSTREPVAVATNRDAFIGAFHTLKDPVGLKSEVIPQTPGTGHNICAAQQWMVTLLPGETWRTDFVIGIQPADAEEANAAELAELQQTETIDRLWLTTQAWWNEILESFSIQTPDDNINLIVNGWNKLQVMVNFFFGRSPSYYHKSQYPSVRDQSQDTFGAMLISPELAREKILHIGKFFFADGRAGAGCNRIGLKENASIKVDVPLWLSLMVGDYIRETGDWDILDVSLPLLDGGCSTIYEKMRNGMDRIVTDKGPHGLPLIGRGDWNDAADQIGAKGLGESVWLAQFLCFSVKETAFIFEHKGDKESLSKYLGVAEAQGKIITEQCWDGEWFVRAFKDDGTPVGAKGSEEGFIWINSQTWAVMAEVGTAEQRHKCMDSVIRHLETDYGLMNLAPAYTKPDPTIGIITAFKPGFKENAAVFSHASTFNVCARAKLGRGKDAVDLFRKLLPQTKSSDRYLLEPYAYSQFVAGPAAGDELGRGGWHWLSGTAAWMIRGLSDYIFGVRAEVDGLSIKPAVDPSWKEFKLVRRFRGCKYTFKFHNPHGVERGVASILIDGKQCKGTKLPLPTAPAHQIEVTLG